MRRYRLPLRAVVRTAHGVMTEREGVIVRLEDPSTSSGQVPGRVGFGEAAPVPGFGGGTVDEIEAALRELGGPFDGAQGRAVSGEELAEFSRFARGRLACAGVAVESALAEFRQTVGQVADLASQSEKNSKDRDQAGKESRSQVSDPAYNQTLPVAALLPAGVAALRKIETLGEAGFRTFKWKVGVAEVGEELPLLDDVCAELPKGARLRLDANGAWDRRSAERWLERCAERPVEFVEQPCADGAWAGASGRARAEDLLRGLAEDFPTPVALDESLVGEGDVERWLGAGWRGVWVVKPGLLGGAALARLRQAGADVVFSSALETAVGARAALRVAFGWCRGGMGVPPVGLKSAEHGQDARATQTRALGFGVWPLFEDARFDGPYLAPFLGAAEVERLNAEAVWNALS